MKTYQPSMKNQIRYLFIILMMMLLAVVSCIAFYYWKLSIDDMVMKIQEASNVSILHEIKTFIATPAKMNEKNSLFIKNGLVDINNALDRERFFSGVMQAASPNVYSFSYGTYTGEYYGVRRNPQNQLEFMKSDTTTQGHSQYYAVNDDFTEGELRLTLDQFDPRTRSWYQLAEQTHKPAFAPVYEHFIMNDLALSASYPIYNKENNLMGVLGTHIILSEMNQKLKEVVRNKNAIAYIVEKDSNKLVANTEDEPNFTIDPAGTIDRITSSQIKNEIIREALASYNEDETRDFIEDTKTGQWYIKISELKKDGLNWLIIMATPEDHYIAQLKQSILFSVFLSILTIITAIVIWTKKIDQYLKPIYDLIHITEKYASGDLSERANISKHDEIGKLGSAFNKMAEELEALINDLESKVIERTKELERRNTEVAKAKEQLEFSAQTDFLTGLYNRKFIIQQMEKEIESFAVKHAEFAVIMLDLDYFKKVNDAYGHDCGDLVLKDTAMTMQQVFRPEDCISRWGGEEFLIFLPKTSLPEAVELAEMLRSRINNHVFICKKACVKVTMTLGIAMYKTDLSLDEVIKNADIAVYHGKSSGRNQVCCFDTIQKAAD
jgi:diguanylate cyclase (GGDEF)-like protein